MSAVQGGAEEAGAEDGGAEGLGRRVRRGPDGGCVVGDGRQPASIDLVGGWQSTDERKVPRLYRGGSLVPGHGCARY